MSITIRPIETADYDAWYPLWQCYLTFYKSSVEDHVTKHNFARICDPDGDLYGFCALAADGEDNAGQMLGFVTYLYHPFTWSVGLRCYLGDLFTVPEARGKGVARKLIEIVNTTAKKDGAEQVYWMTQEFNYQGRMLYDKVAERTPFIKYQQKL